MANEPARLIGAVFNVELIEFEPTPQERMVVQSRYRFRCYNGLIISVIYGPVSMNQWELAVLDSEGTIVAVPGIIDAEPVRLAESSEVTELINKIAGYRIKELGRRYLPIPKLTDNSEIK